MGKGILDRMNNLPISGRLLQNNVIPPWMREFRRNRNWEVWIPALQWGRLRGNDGLSYLL